MICAPDLTSRRHAIRRRRFSSNYRHVAVRFGGDHMGTKLRICTRRTHRISPNNPFNWSNLVGAPHPAGATGVGLMFPVRC